MTGGEIIRAALTAGSPLPTRVGLKVRQDAADEQDGYAFIIFRRVSVERQRGLGGVLLAMRETFHIECWGETREDADVLEAEAIAALTAAGLYPDENEIDGLDPEVKVRVAVFAVDVWTTPSIESAITVEPPQTNPNVWTPPDQGLADTFTAADGTDPTSRALDLHPTSVSNWTPYLFVGMPNSGAIIGNRLVSNRTSFPYPVGLAVSTDVFLRSTPFLMLLHGDGGSGSGISDGVIAEAYGASIYVAVKLNKVGGYLCDADSFHSEGSGLTPGEHRIGIYVGTSTAVLIIDGVAVDESSSMPFTPDIDGCNLIIYAAAAGSDAAISAFAIVPAISLAQAIALTLP